MADELIVAGGVSAAPLAYTVPGAQEIIVKALFATFDGSAAAAAFLPCVRVLAPGGKVVGEYITDSTVAAGASAEVSFFPLGGRGGGGNTGITQPSNIPLDGADASGNAYLALSPSNGFTNSRRVVPAFNALVVGTWDGSFIVPNNYGSAGTVVLSFVANAVVGALRVRVSSAVVAAGVSEDTAYTNEAYVNTTVPGTALQRFDVSFVLSTAPVAGSSLNIRVTRDGADAADTLGVSALLWNTAFRYTGA